MKIDGREIALTGGAPMFDRPRPTGQIHTPDVDAFIGRLDRILDGRRYSNGGPLQEELEDRLAAWHQVDHVVTFGNACFALIALMRHLARPDAGDILLPSFSYRGLPHFVQWAGKMPRFCDVDEGTHGLTAETAAQQADRGDVAAILSVNNVNGPSDLEGLDGLAQELGVPLIHDSVYAIAAEWNGAPFGRHGVAEVFSLHATKLVNGFEGGYVTTNDRALAEAMRNIRNFGYDTASPQILHLGMNGKLNEIHAAMALTSLEEIDRALAHNREIIAAYRSVIGDDAGVRIVEPEAGMVPNDEMVLLEVDDDHELGRDGLLRVLQADGAHARPYFDPPLHRSKNCPPAAAGAELPVSDRLATRFAQLPTGAFVSNTDATSIAHLVVELDRRAGEAARAVAAG